MSNALVKQSLDLLEFENDVIKETRKKNKKKKTSSQGVLDLIPHHQRLISKSNVKDCKSLFKRTSKLTVTEAKKQLKADIDRAEENVRKLLQLSSYSYATDNVEKVFLRGVKKRYIVEEDKPKEEEKTAFTEEDFKKFEAEYFG